MIASQTATWISPNLVLNHGRSSLRTWLPSPLLQPPGWIRRRGVVATAPAFNAKLSAAMIVTSFSFDETEESLFQVLLPSTEL